MSGRGRTPIFSFEGFDTPSRRTTSSNRSRVPSARNVLNGIVNAGTTPPTATASTTDHTDSGGNIADTGDTSVTNAVKHLRDQQKKLQASTATIEEMLKQLTENHEKNVTASVTRPSIPRALSRIVHDVYDKLLDEQEEMRWNLQECYDHVSNRQVNTTLIRNIQGVLKENEYDPTMIKRAVRTYFKSKKSDHQREWSGKKSCTAASSRKRQRRHNKARARLRVLNISKNIDEASKKKWNLCL